MREIGLGERGNETTKKGGKKAARARAETQFSKALFCFRLEFLRMLFFRSYSHHHAAQPSAEADLVQQQQRQHLQQQQQQQQQHLADYCNVQPRAGYDQQQGTVLHTT